MFGYSSIALIVSPKLFCVACGILGMVMSVLDFIEKLWIKMLFYRLDVSVKLWYNTYRKGDIKMKFTVTAKPNMPCVDEEFIVNGKKAEVSDFNLV